MKKTGIVMALTGDGKGKTTAALGMVLRASGHGQKCLIVQFLKGSDRYGEVRAIKRLPGVRLIQSGLDSFISKTNPAKIDIEKAQEGLALAKEATESGEYDLIVLDEIHIALDFQLISEADVLTMIRERPKTVSLVLTGRSMPEAIGQIADTVSEVVEHKHHFYLGIEAQEGIEF